MKTGGTGPMDANKLLSLNVTKAEPVLRLLAAHAGHDDGDFGFEWGWEVFKVFSRLPAMVDDGGSTFQVQATEADPETIEVFFGRQLSERTQYGFMDTRVVGMHFVVHPPDRDAEPVQEDEEVEDQEFWSSDFASIDDFVAAVEGSVGFRIARTRNLMSAVFYSQELDEQGREA